MKRSDVCLFALLCFVSASAAGRPPNVLFMVADDLNVAIGSYGHPTASTPHIDALAARGVRFERAYAQFPLCNPSRTSFLSGLRPDTTRVFAGNTPPRHAIGDVAMLPEYFSAHGYFTARVGKLAHDTFPEAVAWDVSENTSVDPYYMPGVDHAEVRDNTWIEDAERGLTRTAVLERLGRGSGLPLVWRATDQGGGETPDGATASRIIELLREHAHGDRPFFIAAGFHKPHQPWIAPRQYFESHPLATVGLPVQVDDDQADIPSVAFRVLADDAAHTPQQVRQARAAYHATVSLMDAQVGRILSALDGLGIDEDTIIVFFSDHGFHLGEHGGLWRKVTLFEEATRVPLIVASPGRRGGQTAAGLVELVDLYPTLAELAGLPVPAHLEGTSFAPLLDRPGRAWKSAVFSEVLRGTSRGRSIRTARHRYSEWRTGEAIEIELYDLIADPGEFTNLAASPGDRTVRDTLAAALAQGWRGALPDQGASRADTTTNKARGA